MLLEDAQFAGIPKNLKHFVDFMCASIWDRALFRVSIVDILPTLLGT